LSQTTVSDETGSCNAHSRPPGRHIGLWIATAASKLRSSLVLLLPVV
jgi:hypothetical protein